MATGNSVHDEIKEQHQSMKDKPFKEKLAYFWDYYKIHTLVICLVIACAGSFIYTQVTRKDSALDTVFLNTYLNESVAPEQLSADFASYIQLDTKEYEAVFTPNMYIDYENSDQFSIANVQKMIAMVASGSIDVLITDDGYIAQNIDQGMFTDLSEIMPADLLARYEDKLLYMDVADDNKGEIPVGIDIHSSSLFLSDQVPAYFTVISNGLHKETAVQLFNYIMEKYPLQ